MASPTVTQTPPVLPVSNPQFQTTTTTTTKSEAKPEPEPAFRAVLSYVTGSLRQSLSQRRPWAELGDRSALSKPLSFSEASLRMRHNVSYFRVNYYVVVSVILAVSLLTSPTSLFLLAALLASWLFLYLLRPADQPLRLFGRTFSDFETLSLLGAATFVLLFLTSLGSLLVTAFTLSVALVAAHAAFRVPEDLFLDERQGEQSAGFFSILRAAVAAPPAASPVPGRG
ncbi:PRA1 family protein B4 [Cajanus cajan]|uniref:PRA1 family protein n=1 Tax=Cajanus cajan TaxID=3821 RepID=A0A151T995_CAJCA|nr:PRA1 family protein B4 [Cajanus cajan]KYP63618.1 PRA1 family protein B4 [Cajanus cajan]